MVNLPNWLPLSFRIDDGDWFDLREVEILAYRQELDLRRGLYLRTVRFRDVEGRDTRLTERRFIHMQHKNLAGQQLTITAENWSGGLTVRAMLDGEIVNAGVPRYAQYDGKHFRVQKAIVTGPETVLLEGETTQSQLRVTQAARLRAWVRGAEKELKRRSVTEPARVGQEFETELTPGATVEVEKIVALYTSLDRAIADDHVILFWCGIGRQASQSNFSSARGTTTSRLSRRSPRPAEKDEPSALI